MVYLSNVLGAQVNQWFWVILFWAFEGHFMLDFGNESCDLALSWCISSTHYCLSSFLLIIKNTPDHHISISSCLLC